MIVPRSGAPFERGLTGGPDPVELGCERGGVEVRDLGRDGEGVPLRAERRARVHPRSAGFAAIMCASSRYSGAVIAICDVGAGPDLRLLRFARAR